jgi:hypothetical protein
VRVEIRRDDGSAADIDEVGQMIICSPHVSPGYWRRPELDAAAFSVDPQEPCGRHYASGDFGHIDEAGNLHFLGRKGSRVKIRGHSVELMEIEAALAACPGVTKAAVLAKSGETQAESVRLTAYVATRDKTDRDPSRIRRNLATRLPPYMLPAAFVFVDALPLTASGKIDRNALALLETTPAALERKIEPVQDDVERTVAEIFEQLLKLAPVGRGDDFFTLGGDSLLGVELQVRLGDAFGVHVANFHEDATVARIAANIRRDRAAPSAIARALPVLVPLWRHGNAPPLFLVHGRHGQAFVSPHFMQLLGDNQPVWVFQARGLDGLQAPHSNVEDMAAEYLAEMREERPHGPYFLGALCAGAYIAAAMARALREAGESVLPLLLLDPPDRMLNGGYSKMTEERFVDKMVAKRAMGRSMGPVGNPTYMKAVVRTAMAFEDAIVRHRPQPYDGPVYLLSSRRRIQRSDSSELRKIFTGRFKRFEVGDTHAEALDPRNPVFASYLLRCVGLIREAAQVGSPAVKSRYDHLGSSQVHFCAHSKNRRRVDRKCLEEKRHRHRLSLVSREATYVRTRGSDAGRSRNMGRLFQVRVRAKSLGSSGFLVSHVHPTRRGKQVFQLHQRTRADVRRFRDHNHDGNGGKNHLQSTGLRHRRERRSDPGFHRPLRGAAR